MKLKRPFKKTPFYTHLLPRALTTGFLAASVWFIWKFLLDEHAFDLLSPPPFSSQQIVLSLGCTIASTLLGALEWLLLVYALGGQIPPITGLRIHFLSNLTKYIPGFIWPYAGKAYQAARANVPAKIAAASVLGEMAILYLTGALTLILSLPFSGIIPWTVREQIFFQASAIFATIITIYIIPLAGQRITSRLIRAPFTRKINWKQIRLIIIAVLATWGVLGTGFVILTPEISTALWSRTALRHIFALASGLLIGQITFFIPMGMGVREAILVSLSDPTASPTLITVAALTFRLEMLVGEITCAIGALLAEKFLAYIHNKR